MKNPQPLITSLEDLKDAPRFLLRADFPEENGWLDTMRVPLSPEKFAQAYERNYATYDQYLERLAKSEPAPFMGYYAKSYDGAPPVLKCYLRDGMHSLEVDFEGLFDDLCGRVNAALRLPANQPCPIVPVLQQIQLLDDPHEPSHFVYHDREQSTAYVVPWKLWNSLRWLPWLPR
jgi:hypothetical protein